MNVLFLAGALGLAVASAPVNLTADSPAISPGDPVAVNFSIADSALSVTRFANNTSSGWVASNAYVSTNWLPAIYDALDSQYATLTQNYEDLMADYTNSEIKASILQNNAHEYGTLSMNDVAYKTAFDNSAFANTNFMPADNQNTAAIFTGVYNASVGANATTRNDASLIPAEWGTSPSKYTNTGDMTFLQDYAPKTNTVFQDYFGVGFSPKFLAQAFNNVGGLQFYRYSLTFPNGFQVFDLNPVAVALRDYRIYYTLGNPVTGTFEVVSGDLYGSLNRTLTPTPSYPGGVDLAYENADIDGGAYSMHNNAYDGAYIYRIDIFSPEISNYVLYNSMSAYYMAQYAGYASGYAVAANTGADYINGYNDGYAAGQAIGSDNALVGPFALIAGAFNAVASVLNLHVFGSITLGTFIFIPLIVLMIIVLVKLFRG